jgi:alkanesulfonate monooxygenase SsuD/methylene tetrahydromethanopterin reductase-like flavin-dependent oxidoreductase (luciferase family)
VQTSTIRLGTLVTSATFRLPGVLAMSVAQVDQMSAGRVELGLGAGWFEAEHTAYGIPFPAVGERFDRLEEQLSIVTGMWSTPVGERFDFVGRHYRLTDSPALPKPTQTPGVPIIIGGRGPRRTPALAARFGDEFNVPFRSVRETAEVYQRVSAACAVPGARAQGRAPLVLSAAQTVACGRTSEQAKERCATIGQTPLLSGTPDQVVDAIGQFAQAGTQRMFLQVLDITDLDHLDVLASHVLPQVR